MSPQPPTGVALARTPEGLHARVQLPEPVDALTLRQASVIRRDGWSVDGAPFEDGRLDAAEPTARFDVVVPVNAQEHDRVYPSLTRVGEGYVLYGPSLLADQLPADQGATAEGDDVIVPADGTLAGGYVFIGPADMIESRDGYRLIGASTVPLWIADTATQGAEAAFPFFAAYFGPLQTEPVLALSTDSPGPMGFHGDVTDNAFVFLRFHGMQWKADDPRAAAGINTFIRHEAFHLWNAGADPEAPPWLHEGGAEYAAIVAAATSGVLSEADALAQVSARATACKVQHGDRPFAELAPNGSVVYDCGVLVQWLADLSRRADSKGAEHTLTLWATFISDAPPSGYRVEDFRVLAGPLAAGLLDGKGFAWLTTALSEYGVEVVETADPNLDRSDLLKHLMRSTCGEGPIGFWTEDGFVRLDTAETCGVLSNRPEIVAIETHGILDAPSAAMDAAIDRCRAKRPVRATTRAGETIAIPCDAPPTRTPGVRVAKAPAVAVPR